MGELDNLDELGELGELAKLGTLDELVEMGELVELDELGGLDELGELDDCCDINCILLKWLGVTLVTSISSMGWVKIWKRGLHHYWAPVGELINRQINMDKKQSKKCA